jgi:hypothetical protein
MYISFHFLYKDIPSKHKSIFVQKGDTVWIKHYSGKGYYSNGLGFIINSNALFPCVGVRIPLWDVGADLSDETV